MKTVAPSSDTPTIDREQCPSRKAGFEHAYVNQPLVITKYDGTTVTDGWVETCIYCHQPAPRS